jgi:hypothetical protein
MNWIIEFEGFALSRSFVFKELTIRSIEASYSKHFFIKSPCHFDRLIARDKRVVRWCEANLHNIHWFAGKDKFSDVILYLKSNLDQTSTVFTKGRQKVEILKGLKFPGTINNVEDLIIHPLNQLEVEFDDRSSLCPLLFHKKNSHCSHAKSYALLQYFNEPKDEQLPEEESDVFEEISEMQGDEEE